MPGSWGSVMPWRVWHYIFLLCSIFPNKHITSGQERITYPVHLPYPPPIYCKQRVPDGRSIPIHNTIE